MCLDPKRTYGSNQLDGMNHEPPRPVRPSPRTFPDRQIDSRKFGFLQGFSCFIPFLVVCFSRVLVYFQFFFWVIPRATVDCRGLPYGLPCCLVGGQSASLAGLGVQQIGIYQI